jgi:NADH-quinone oxidoreductase subunit C
MNPVQDVAARVQAACEGIPHRARERDGLPSLEVAREDLHALLQRLRDVAGFDSVTFVTGVDHLADRAGEPRFEVVLQLLAVDADARVRVRVLLRSDDAHLPTCVDLWPGAAYMERECFDMFGIVFDGHPNLRRLLMPDDYIYHPLRKDFPHRGIEPDRLYREWDRKRRQGTPFERDAAGNQVGSGNGSAP